MKRILIAIVLCLFLTPLAKSETTVRVATYNIKFLSTNVTQQGDRLEKLIEAIGLLDASVIGLQEIDDRAALELIFPPSTLDIIDTEYFMSSVRDTPFVLKHRCIWFVSLFIMFSPGIISISPL